MTTTARPHPAPANGWTWLHDPQFDLTLVVGTLTISVACGLAVVAQPWLFPLMLALDLWLLGYHHVVATFTRIAFDMESIGQHRFLVTWLPLLVIGGVLALAVGVGVWALATIYLYWQWFHYARQSYGIAQAYRHKAGGAVRESGVVYQVLFYIVPVWGILHRSAQDPSSFLGLKLKVIPVAPIAATIVGWCALAAVLYWATLKVLAAARGELPLLHTLYMASHFAVFAIGYVAIDNLNYGWLVMNMWHNAQYLMFVWLFNNKRFEGRIDERHRLLSMLSQRENAARYVLFCLSLSTAVYTAIYFSLRMAPFALIPAMAVVYQSINFHHYIVDAIIWRRRKAAKSSGPAAAVATA